MHKIQKGIIYIIFNKIIEFTKYLNLVELFKIIGKKYIKDKLLASRLSVDIFIIFKWTLIVVFWTFELKSKFINGLVWYFILTNIYTYFYYHAWTKDLEKKHFDLDRIKRRFLSLINAIVFNVLCFAYFYALPYSSNFKWDVNYSSIIDPLLFSLANSFTANYNSVEIVTQFGHRLILIETIISFIFFTIILSNSIPQMKEK